MSFVFANLVAPVCNAVQEREWFCDNSSKACGSKGPTIRQADSVRQCLVSDMVIGIQQVLFSSDTGHLIANKIEYLV